MAALVTKRKVCRMCESSNLTMVLPIKATPIADAYLSVENINSEQPLIPLDLYQCSNCGHAQNLDIVDPSVLFRDYIFMTSGSKGLIKHFESYADEINNKFHPNPGSLVVEIGSNDGTLLKNFQKLGLCTVGIDPADNIAKKANDDGITTINNFFNLETAKNIKAKYGPAKLVLANNVFAHSDNLKSMVEGISQLLDFDGVFVFEVSYLLDIIDNCLFDTIYHEHLSYHSVKPLKMFFARFGLELFDVEKIGSKGGSIRGFVKKSGGVYPVSSIVDKMILNEDLRGLHGPAIFSQYADYIRSRKKDLTNAMELFRRKSKTIVGYGASTTVTTLMYHFEANKLIDYLIDDNDKKHGMYSPGDHLEVRPSSILYGDNKPDVVVIFAWQYADIIISKHGEYIKNGGVFVVPLPNLRIY